MTHKCKGCDAEAEDNECYECKDYCRCKYCFDGQGEEGTDDFNKYQKQKHQWYAEPEFDD